MAENKIIFHIILQKVQFLHFLKFSFLKRKMCKVGSSSCVLSIKVPIQSWQCCDYSQTQSPNIQPRQDQSLIQILVPLPPPYPKERALMAHLPRW